MTASCARGPRPEARMSDDPALERLLRRDRVITAVGLAALCMLAWLYVLAGAGLGHSAWEMTRLSLFPHLAQPPAASGGTAIDAMAMPGMAMGTMDTRTAAWSVAAWALTVAMWWTM